MLFFLFKTQLFSGSLEITSNNTVTHLFRYRHNVKSLPEILYCIKV